MAVSGWLVLDKPLNITSAQLVGIVKRNLRNVTGEKIKIGHTGTLDPLATGILPLALGEATKLAQFFLDCYKSYHFTIFWGKKTNTADAEGFVIAETETIPSVQDIEKIIPQFTGAISQIPPKFSALKVDGQRAYDLARNNIDFELQKRDIIIQSLELVSHCSEKKQSQFVVTCSKGTYIRTLGEDIAEACGSLGYLSALRRTKVGFFSENHAILPDISCDMMYKAILSITEPLNGISAIYVNTTQEKALRFGQSIIWNGVIPEQMVFPVMNDNQNLVALASYSETVVVPKRIFNM
jgi:tRNA pseudouridine55 synthase